MTTQSRMWNWEGLLGKKEGLQGGPSPGVGDNSGRKLQRGEISMSKRVWAQHRPETQTTRIFSFILKRAIQDSLLYGDLEGGAHLLGPIAIIVERSHGPYKTTRKATPGKHYQWHAFGLRASFLLGALSYME